jgi:hypothetical protein
MTTMPKPVRQRPSRLKALSADSVAKLKDAAQHTPRAASTDGSVEHPGVERWPVKTGTDADVAQVGVNQLGGSNLGPGLVDTSIEEMLTFKRAANMPPVSRSFPKNSFYQNRRTAPTETTVWRLRALVTEARLEQDGDYHLVLQGVSQKTMIGEIPNPDPAYVGNPVWLADIKVARDAVNKKLGSPLQPVGFQAADMGPPKTERSTAQAPEPEAPMTQIQAWATIVGVGFFDCDHGQVGVASGTAIELHPIFSIVFE